jgi:hypothetical protein
MKNNLAGGEIMLTASQWIEAIATLFAAVAAVSAYLLNRSVANVEKRKIVLDIYERLFTRKECMKVLKRIVIEPNQFWVSTEYLEEDPSRLDDEDILTDFDIDEYLGYFELLGGLVKRRAVNFEDVYDAFGYYIEKAWKHKGIQKYIEGEREESSDMYEQFEYLSRRIIIMSKKDEETSKKGTQT